MKLSIERASVIAQGLRGLDGYEKLVKDGASERIMRAPLTLTGVTRAKVARNLAAIDNVLGPIDSARRQLLRSMSDTSGGVPKERQVEYNEQEAQMFAQEEEFDLKMINENELNLAINPIPITVLSFLEPLITREGE